MGEGGADGGGGALELGRGGGGAWRVHTHWLLQTKLATSREALILRKKKNLLKTFNED